MGNSTLPVLWVGAALVACSFPMPRPGELPPEDAGVDAVPPLPLPPALIDFLPASEEVLSDISWTITSDTEINTTTGTIDFLPPVGIGLAMAMQRDNTSSVAILRVKSLNVAAGVTVTATG